jgi:hypothetical protein
MGYGRVVMNNACHSPEWAHEHYYSDLIEQGRGGKGYYT